MPEGNLQTRIESIVSQVTGVNCIHPTLPLTGIGLDSSAVVELVVELEEEFGFMLPDEELRQENFRDISTIEKMIARQFKE